ncbi:MAG: hypothetical protein P1U56_03985 [Saprospiraceae bacterium]|nr:hypothetical protein [Saprospiraceae bacterium]
MNTIYSKVLTILLIAVQISMGQEKIPFDTINWKISENASYVVERFEGKNALYLKGGSITHKTLNFTNGTIEFDIFLKPDRGFPGISFRAVKDNAEKFYFRPHLSGKPDCNQAIALINNITPWQLYFGPKYSFPYSYKFDDWTHVKIVVNENKAQIFLDYSETPQLSWQLFHPTRAGELQFNGGNNSAVHIADIKVDIDQSEISNFIPGKRESISGLIQKWEISDMFSKEKLNDPNNFSSTIEERSWGRVVQVEEGVAANISRQQDLFNGDPGETVFAKVKLQSDEDQIKLFQFGYSDEVVVILNGKAIYKGTNAFRSRDYRFLGTIGLFDGVYLDLKKGENTLLLAVSENFGGWLVTGKLTDYTGVTVSDN